VGCRAIGGADPEPSAAPEGPPKALPGEAAQAARIAYYQAVDGPGVFAPRGWHCQTWRGSHGAFIIVTPTSPPEIIPRESVQGPGVIAIWSSGGTGGRFEVAEVSARLFPQVMADFIARVKAEGFPSPDFSKIHPFSDDQLHVSDAEAGQIHDPRPARGHRYGHLRTLDGSRAWCRQSIPRRWSLS
jgi:hypothetical protein